MRLAFQIVVSILVILFISACGIESGTSQQVGIPITSNSIKSNTGRFSVTYHGFFTAGTEDYKSNRAVYTIIDNSTGQEYIGIEGVGVSSCRMNGKTFAAE